MPAKELVFVDECGAHIGLTPLYARAPRGQRAFGLVPRTRGKNTTLIAGLSLAGIQAPMILEGGVDTPGFEAYVEQILAPTRSPGHIVVLDNLSVHTGERVRQAIEARGCQVLSPVSLFTGLDAHRGSVLQAERLASPAGSAHA